jgi:hypothetical protein
LIADQSITTPSSRHVNLFDPRARRPIRLQPPVAVALALATSQSLRSGSLFALFDLTQTPIASHRHTRLPVSSRSGTDVWAD